MDAFKTRVRTFDAFPKVDSQHTVRSSRGGLSTLLTTFCGLLIIWVQIGGYLGGYVDHQFTVDDEIRKDLKLNMDMLIAMPCEFIHTNVEDITNDRFLANELLNFQGSQFFLPSRFEINNENTAHDRPKLDEIMQETMRAEFYTEGLIVNADAPACHIFGSVPVNQVSGEFRITGRGIGYGDFRSVSLNQLNFSHVISEFSYGEFYPFIDNPLDYTGKVTDAKLKVYNYNSKVVPTLYQKLGLIVDTNQYSLTEFHVDLETKDGGGVPGIYFRYEFEPIKLITIERRMGFLQFLSRLATLIGGLIILAGYLYRLYEHLLTIVFGKKFVERDTEHKEGGLLDYSAKNLKS